MSSGRVHLDSRGPKTQASETTQTTRRRRRAFRRMSPTHSTRARAVSAARAFAFARLGTFRTYCVGRLRDRMRLVSAKTGDG